MYMCSIFVLQQKQKARVKMRAPTAILTITPTAMLTALPTMVLVSAIALAAVARTAVT